MILLVAATTFEIAAVAETPPSQVEMLITGVGMANTLYHLQKKLSLQKYDLVIQAGIAGTFTTELALGETVLVQRDTFGDIGMEEKEQFQPIFQTGFADANAFPFKEGWLVNQHADLTTTALKTVSGVTINKVSDSLLQQQQLQSVFRPDIETMEGAAFHYVCLQEQVSFLQLRSISNTVGERDKSKWKIREAINHLNKALLEIIQTKTHY